MGRAVKRMRARARAFMRGVMRGAAAPVDTYIVHTYPYPHESEQEAIRDDWRRVGDTLRDSVKLLNERRAS